MVPIAASIAAGVIAASAAADRVPMSPPLRVTIVATAAVNRTLLDGTLAEAAAIWRTAGVTIVWRRAARDHSDPSPSDLTVTMDDGAFASPNGNATLGWITFAGAETPIPDIHLSRGNALDLMTRTASIHDLPAVTQDYLLGRALGRALAHELGHYLLKSRAHEPKGLMRAARPSADFFSPSRLGFGLTPDEIARLAHTLLCADADMMR